MNLSRYITRSSMATQTLRLPYPEGAKGGRRLKLTCQSVPHTVSPICHYSATACDSYLGITWNTDDPIAQDTRIGYRTIDVNSGSRSCVARIKELWEHCESSHQQCRLEETPQLPARVLDLAALDECSTVALLETERAIRLPYITLSHCWGKPSPSRLILKRENLEELKSGIAIDRLTPVFQDAISVTSRLGIQFLWIDALCIIQDSKEDWAEESVRMGTIYRDATLNIASSCSPDSNMRFLRPRPIKPSWSIPFYSTETGQSGNITWRPMRGVEAVVDHHLAGPLQSRAWCFQERVLSRRTIFFDEYQFLWECHEGHIPEGAASFTDLTMYGLGGNRNMKPYTKLNSDLGNHGTSEPEKVVASAPQDTFSMYWYQTLREYFLRKLTFYADTLPALSAIAKAYGSIAGDTYLAGIWQGDLHRGLLWYCAYDCVDTTKLIHSPSPSDIPDEVTRNIDAPSWSWASVSKNSGTIEPSIVLGGSTRRRGNVDKDAVFIQAELMPRFGDLEGRLISAALHLKGLTRQISLSHDTSLAGLSAELTMDEPTYGMSANAQFDPDAVFEEYQRRQHEKGRAQYLAFLLSQWDIIHHDTQATLRGLLLVPAAVGGQFVRKGIFTIVPGEKGEEDLERDRADKAYRAGWRKVSTRKATFEGTWAGWEEKTVIIT